SRSSNFLNTNSNSNSAVSSLLLANKEYILAPNASSQYQALILIKEAVTKVNKYKNLLLNTNDIDLSLKQNFEKKKEKQLNEEGIAQIFSYCEDDYKTQTSDSCKKTTSKNQNQTSLSDLELPIVLIEHVELPYLSTEEVIKFLEYLDNDNHQIQLSNSNIMEDFFNLLSIRPSH
ncbi:24509_t:CDS:2, partial [Dentiscutata erythropus]